ncbi:signal recognition particle protein [Candidatus Micrarchaeota archaeon]|nr:signal recognition particle protein [Candidatus Micrarchaeota archaeon]
MLNKLRDLFSKITRAGMVDDAFVEDMVKDLQRILISSDVNVSLVRALSENIRKKAKAELPPGVSRKESFTKLVYDELVKILGGEGSTPRMDKHRVLLVGLYGSGKTTTMGKLARFYSKRGLRTCMITVDVWRPAAFEQLRQIGEQVKVTVVAGEQKGKPADILKNALKEADGFDLILVDSAGRDSLNKELLDEIVEVKRLLKPDEIYLVISADIGQTARTQAEKFREAVGLTGVIVSKADSSGKAGGALSACHAAGVPVVFVGTGEKPDDFELFDSRKFVSKLLGFPDLGELVKKAKEAAEEAEFSPEQLLEGEYTLKTFYNQLEATRKMGPLKKVFEMFGAGSMPEELVQTSESKLRTYKVIMDSMTDEELANPDVIKGTRILRVARGSGRSEAEVKDLLKQFENSKKMIQKIRKGKFRGLPGVFSKLKGMPGA